MLKTFQKHLRQNQTDAELRLWQQLRDRRFQNFKFRRQQILQGYIVDFICLEKKLIIELDGGQQSKKDMILHVVVGLKEMGFECYVFGIMRC